MSLPYFPFYVTDYEADTSHLSLEEDGAYVRLLRLCWRTPGCSVPDDPTWIAKRMRVDLDTFHSLIKPLIDDYFSIEKGRIFSPRLTTEYAKTQAKAKAARENGKKGGRKAKTLKNNNNTKPKASNQLNPEKSYPEPELDKEKELSDDSSKKAGRNGSRLPENWTASNADIQFAIGEGLSFEAAHREASKFRDYWHSATGAKATKRDWQATWRNWIRNARDRSPRQSAPSDQHRNQDMIQAFADIARESSQ